MGRFPGVAIPCLLLAAAPCRLPAAERADPGRPLAIRVETLTVPPATRPLLTVIARNRGETAWSGRLSVEGPESWQLTPPVREVDLAPGETQRVAFSIQRARNAKDNEYAFQVSASDGESMHVHRQVTFVASAPYFKPAIDGDPGDWEDAIPLTFSHGGRRTVIRTFWNRRRFSILVAVQEDRLVPYGSGAERIDAVQLALAPLDDPQAPPPPGVGRFEFLLAATPEGARCLQLAGWETAAEETQRTRPLEPLELEAAEVAVRRRGGWTWYECGLPFSVMQQGLRPSEGREFLMSVLVHDPDGTGIRDLGQAVGLWPAPEDAEAWSRWPGSGGQASDLRAPRVRWGFCTSKY